MILVVNKEAATSMFSINTMRIEQEGDPSTINNSNITLPQNVKHLYFFFYTIMEWIS